MPESWQGVAISCRFRVSELSSSKDELIDPGILEIMQQLKGEG